MKNRYCIYKNTKNGKVAVQLVLLKKYFILVTIKFIVAGVRKTIFFTKMIVNSIGL